MRTLLYLSLVLSMALASPAQQEPKPLPRPIPEKPEPPKPFGELRVHVESPAGTPVAEAMVAIAKLNRAHPTGASGDVILAWIPEGSHEITVSKAGYRAAAAKATIKAEGITVLTVKLEPETK